MSNSESITEAQLEQIRALGLPARQENNAYLVYSCRGDGVALPESVVAKVYSGKRGLTLVCTDSYALWQLRPTRVLSVDDSGWGFYLLGVLCGLHDSATGALSCAEVPVENFQGQRFRSHAYLDAYADAAVRLEGLEERHRQYVAAGVGADVYDDPKALGDKAAIARSYDRVRQFVAEHDLWRLCKTGWDDKRRDGDHDGH
eukprot:m51a1_g9231 hypothetical protein (201) ;mRNA; f:79859-80837